MNQRFRACFALALILTGGLTKLCQGATSDPLQTKVTVYVEDKLGIPGPALSQGKWLAGAMFAKIGVHVEWRSGQPSQSSSDRPIIIELAANAPDNLSPGALAFAQPYEGIHITILYHRIEYIAVHHQFRDRLLAHVLVHEITHIVEGVDRHSDAGVMKAHWTQADYSEIESSLLPFTPEDVRLIYQGLAARSSPTAAKTDTNGPRSSGYSLIPVPALGKS